MPNSRAKSLGDLGIYGYIQTHQLYDMAYTIGSSYEYLKKTPLFHISGIRTDIYMADKAKFLFSHFFNLIMVSHLAREVAVRHSKRELVAAEVIGSGRRGVWDALL